MNKYYHAKTQTLYTTESCEFCEAEVIPANGTQYSDTCPEDAKPVKKMHPEIDVTEDGDAHCGCLTIRTPEPGDPVIYEVAKLGSWTNGTLVSRNGGWSTVKTQDGEEIKLRNSKVAYDIHANTEPEEDDIDSELKRSSTAVDRSHLIPCRTNKGRKSVHNGDKVARLLVGKDLEDVYKITADILPGQTVDALRIAYEHLNPGQQRMCCGNRIRGAIKRGEIEAKSLRL